VVSVSSAAGAKRGELLEKIKSKTAKQKKTKAEENKQKKEGGGNLI